MGGLCFKTQTDNHKKYKTEPIKLRALYDYSGINEGDLEFKKGDRLEIVDKEDNEDWWKAKHLKSQKKGYIPSNYVCVDDGTPQSQDWWYNYDRRESNKMLLSAGLSAGTFLVRESTDKRSYVLSVRDEELSSNEPSIRHYRIKRLDNNSGFYINHKNKFQTLLDLIEFYKESRNGLCCTLHKACPKYRPVVPFIQLEIDRAAIEFDQEIGSGYFGKVYKAKLRNCVDVAVKTLQPGKMPNSTFLEEAKVMHHLNHPRLVQLIHVCTKSDPIWIITEFMDNGSLLKYLRSEAGKELKFPALIHMASEIAEGMEHLEKKNLIHRDLRADNVLVGDRLQVKIADFGLARKLNDDDDIYDAAETTKFPIKWTSPEAANYRKFSIKSDVWSFGVLLFELITYGRQPYTGKTGYETLQFISKGKRMSKPENSPCTDEYYEIMLLCWKTKPEERPTFEYLFHTFGDYYVNTEREYSESENY